MTSQKDRQMPNQSNSHSSSSGAQRSRKKKRPWIPALFLIAILAASGLLAQRILRPKTDLSAEGGTIAAQKGNLMVTVTASGPIRARNSTQYKCQVERRGGAEVTILSIVEPGTYITQEDVDNGKVLIQLDASGLKDRLIQEEMKLSNEREGVTAATESYGIQILTNESNVATDELNLRFSLLELQKYLGADLANELVKDVNNIVSLTDHVAPVIAQAMADPNILIGSGAFEELKKWKDDIVLAQGSLKNAQATLLGTEQLHDANYVSDLELDQDRLSLTRNEFSLETSKVNLELFVQYDFPKNAEQLLSVYIEDGRKLLRTQATCRSQLAQAQAKLNNAKLTFQHQDEQVTELIEQITFCTMKAKAPGLVIYGSGDSGDMYRMMRGRGGSSGVIAEGEAVYEGQTLISMPDTAAMIAEIGVHETEVDKVRVGQPANIVFDAFPDNRLQGEVLEVAPLPDQQRGFLNPDLKVYKTQIKIIGTHEFLKTRMSCKVEILVQDLEDVIKVPIQVVANRRGSKVCYVKTAQGSEERVVKTGAFDDTFAEITEGLEVGEEVLLNPPMFTEGVGEGGEDEERFGGRKAMEVDPAAPTPKAGPAPGGRRTGGQGSRPGSAAGARPAGAQFKLPEGMIDGAIAAIKKSDPAKGAELEKLRKDNPAEFQKKLQEYGRSLMGQKGGRRPGGAQGGRTGGAGMPGGGGNRGNRPGGGGGGNRPRNN
jgi:HlyD family secretion protein